jgi:hypothetical protein
LSGDNCGANNCHNDSNDKENEFLRRMIAEQNKQLLSLARASAEITARS